MARPVEEDSRGIVDPASMLEAVSFSRHDPSPAVAPFVSWYWAARWDLPPGRVHRQEVLAHPAVNVSWGPTWAEVHGVQRRRQVRVLDGEGWVLGVLFRPAGFRLAGGPMNRLTDKVVPTADVVAGARGVADSVRRARDEGPAAQAAVVDAWLVGLLSGVAEGPWVTARDLVERVATDRSVRRVDDLAAAAGVGVRRLQRLFADEVGVTPKWVLRRYRLYEAGERAVRDEDVDWAALAAELGYSDQAHLTREFTRAFGQPPATYAHRHRSVPAPAASR